MPTTIVVLPTHRGISPRSVLYDTAKGYRSGVLMARELVFSSIFLLVQPTLPPTLPALLSHQLADEIAIALQSPALLCDNLTMKCILDCAAPVVFSRDGAAALVNAGIIPHLITTTRHNYHFEKALGVL